MAIKEPRRRAERGPGGYGDGASMGPRKSAALRQPHDWSKNQSTTQLLAKLKLEDTPGNQGEVSRGQDRPLEISDPALLCRHDPNQTPSRHPNFWAAFTAIGAPD